MHKFVFFIYSLNILVFLFFLNYEDMMIVEINALSLMIGNTLECILTTRYYILQ